MGVSIDTQAVSDAVAAGVDKSKAIIAAYELANEGKSQSATTISAAAAASSADSNASHSVQLPPPIASQRPHDVVFGKVEGEDRGPNAFEPRKRADPWFWLRDDAREDETILSHLRLENAYTQQQTSHLAALRAELYDEHISHLKQTDERPAFVLGPWFYYTRTVEGLSYKIHCRKPRRGDERVPAPDADEEVLLDENKLAEGKSHCVVRSVKPSPDHCKIAYAVDTKGDEGYAVFIVTLASGDTLDTGIANTSGALHWGADDTVLYYTTRDETKRPYKLWRHRLGASAQSSAVGDDDGDELLLTEADSQFWLGAYKSKSGRFLFTHSASSETAEMRMVDLKAGPSSPLVVVQLRRPGVLFEVEHFGDNLVISTDAEKAINRRLMSAPITAPGAENWREIIPYDASRKIDDVDVFENFIALSGRQDGLTQVWTILCSPADVTAAAERGPTSTHLVPRRIAVPEDVYEIGLSANAEYGLPYVRIHFSSLTTPTTWLDYEPAAVTAGSRVTASGDAGNNRFGAGFTVIKEEIVLNYDRSLYVSERRFATASDGTRIPMCIVRRKDIYDCDGGGSADGGNSDSPPSPKPLMLYGYGSYGICIDPDFDRRVLPYLDRGVIYCIANIRGGGEMGRYWYEEQGKYLNKRNTFSDFISCAECLVEGGFTRPELMACEGRSAGGLLVGNVVNMRPDLFHVAVAGVPFVDLMNTMCDPSIPLTTSEWEEWGNPNEDKYFDYMLSYSPYDNVRAQPYPNMLVTAGLHDPRVAYWEPTKWVSKLRATKVNDNGKEVLLKMDLDAGHFSASDRYKYIRERAFEQAYVLDKLGVGQLATSAGASSKL